LEPGTLACRYVSSGGGHLAENLHVMAAQRGLMVAASSAFHSITQACEPPGLKLKQISKGRKDIIG